ncbi:NAD(P)H-binding protein [Agromyces sp. ISL-38]|uniref:SDR family oxidoreductase n=1 Tax=Agromyces sp. ISL-38 TaxID=2819107 RepID=UPI001BEA66C9|nr:NmrA family NAD(P)-binding protein [Agromyces sp. ISL-38]MBT2499288.1 NAD(P)H-binding protein [Agromyces sp. ISL-38]MBT2518175.1 NAD(P)H-binding protein [Streptomyces sp. ISL-90]
MKVAVIGGTGLIGTRLVAGLTADGHDVVSVSRATGVNSYTGEGLAEALAGAEILIDVSNSGYLDERGANDFFYGSTLNLLTHGAAAGVRHHVALSVVGTDRLARTEGGYFAAKAAQERLIRGSGRPFSIVHATQFFEFIASIADAATSQHIARLSHALIQPIAAQDVAAAIEAVAFGTPVNGIVEFAGPDLFRLGKLMREDLRIRDDPRELVADPLARYFGTDLDERELLPGPDATIAPTRFSEWITGETGPAGGRADRSISPIGG